jgi:hypothetical protein
MQIVFLPWLFLKESVTLGLLTFQTLRDEEGGIAPNLADLEDPITAILQGYVDMRGQPFGTCVVVTHSDRNPTWDLHDEDHDMIGKYARLLFLSGMAKNDYNTSLGCYTNASTFQFFRQRFAKPVDFIMFGTRRRDGNTIDGGYRHGDVKFPVPPQSKHSRDTCIDTDFAKGLAAALEANTDTANRIQAGLVFFSLANTDSDTMEQEAEVILLCSAYEQLLGIEAKARAFNEAIGTFLAPYTSITAAQAITARPGIVFEQKYLAAQKAWPVHRKWAEEFYHLRNSYTHGNNPNERTWGWHPLEHLVMGTFLFPLLTKLLLREEGYYILTEDDEGALKAVDKLLVVNAWGKQVGSHSNATAWQEILRKAVNDLKMLNAIEKAVEDFEKKGIFPPDEQDDDEPNE